MFLRIYNGKHISQLFNKAESYFRLNSKPEMDSTQEWTLQIIAAYSYKPCLVISFILKRQIYYTFSNLLGVHLNVIAQVKCHFIEIYLILHILSYI